MLEDMNRKLLGKFHHFCRISATDFEHLLIKIGPIIMKDGTNMRKAITFLVSGDSFTSLSYLLNCSNQVIPNIVHENELRNFVKVT